MSLTLAHPPHPGELIREDVLPEYGLNVTEAAKLLHAARPNLSNFLNEKAGVSPALALKIEAVFGVPARMLLNMQAAYDLADAVEHRDEIIKGLTRAQPAHA